MISYAVPADLEQPFAFWGVQLPPDEQQAAHLALAQRDVSRYLGATYDPTTLDDDQAQALRDATVIQAAFRVAQGQTASLGTDDGLASVGDLSFSLRPVPRFSTMAAERLAGYGLLGRSGVASPDPDAVTYSG